MASVSCNTIHEEIMQCEYYSACNSLAAAVHKVSKNRFHVSVLQLYLGLDIALPDVEAWRLTRPQLFHSCGLRIQIPNQEASCKQI